MTIPAVAQNFPPPESVVTNDDKTITQDWRFFLLALWQRTGEGTGTPTTGTIDGSNSTMLPFDINIVPNAGPGDITLFPLQPGENQTVVNDRVGPTNVNAPNGYTMDLGGAPYSLASTKIQIFTCVAQNDIRSLQLG